LPSCDLSHFKISHKGNNPLRTQQSGGIRHFSRKCPSGWNRRCLEGQAHPIGWGSRR